MLHVQYGDVYTITSRPYMCIYVNLYVDTYSAVWAVHTSVALGTGMLPVLFTYYIPLLLWAIPECIVLPQIAALCCAFSSC